MGVGSGATGTGGATGSSTSGTVGCTTGAARVVAAVARVVSAVVVARVGMGATPPAGPVRVDLQRQLSSFDLLPLWLLHAPGNLAHTVIGTPRQR